MTKTPCPATDGAVHPHGRGDNFQYVYYPKQENGSPPRAWGQCPCPPVHLAGQRFTPTGVGTMPTPLRLTSFPSVHPHGRGDNGEREAPHPAHAGSPPRAWGQCGGVSPRHARLRFTPTGVGTMMWRRTATTGSAVHPHGRGDNIWRRWSAEPQHGSPPRAWGQSRRAHARSYCQRFTPTGVGTIRERRT